MATRKKRPTRGKGSSDDATTKGTGGEFLTSPEVKTGLLALRTGVKPVQYSVINGLAMFEGDIVLGTDGEVQAQTEALRAGPSVAAGVVIPGAQFHWANCRIPYTIDPALPNQARVTDAIAHWESKTNYRFVVRTTQADWITFRPATGCSSHVGKQGGQQFINLAAGCTKGNTIHEIGHAIGLWHEQSREDRDLFVTINWAKIQSGTSHNFNQHITDGDDVGAYDYGSIMHYPRDAFSVDGSATIVPINPPGAAIGQRAALSPGDIAAANSLCSSGTLTTKKELTSDPVTIKETVKDIRLDTVKERIKDIVKDIRKDVIKDRKEPIFDPVKRNFEGPRIPGGGVVIQPRIGRGAMPFAVAAPHQAPGAGEAGGMGEDQIMALDAQLQQLAAALSEAETNRDVLQQQYDETLALLNQALDAYEGR